MASCVVDLLDPVLRLMFLRLTVPQRELIWALWESAPRRAFPIAAKMLAKV